MSLFRVSCLRLSSSVKLMSLKILLFLAVAAIPAYGASQPDTVRVDNLPMYGQPDIKRPDHLKQLDEHFIVNATKAFGSREKASLNWYGQGEEFMNRGNADMAMRRYNQSWLLNPESFLPYWGFGRALLARKDCEGAIRQFARARELVKAEPRKMALLSDSGVAYGYCATITPPWQPELRKKHYENANRLFDESTRLDPAHAVAWYRWSQVLLQQGRAQEAWEKVRRAQSGGYPVPDDYLARLRKRMPQPK